MKKAFTMLELVFVIVIISIITTITLSNRESTTLQEAAIQLISHIRYTQHLAFVDDKYNPNDDIWYKRRWQLIFGKSAYTDYEVSYTIFSDILATASGNPDEEEIARNPMDRNRRLTGGHSGTMHIYNDANKVTKRMNLGLTYGIKTYNLSGGCSNARLTFDHLGRPLTGNPSSMTMPYQSSRLISQTCRITLTSDEGSITIAVEPETGYAHIL